MFTNRLIWPDAFRGLLILLVVLGHSLQHGDFENRLAWNLIYSFHMPAFFVVSGYVNYKDVYKLSSIKRKAIQLLLPFMSWAIVGTIINDGGWAQMINILLKPDNSYWFLFVLFIIISLFILVVVLCEKCNVKSDGILLAVVCSLVLVMLFSEFRLLGFQFISYYFGFYVLGYMLRKYRPKFPPILVILLGTVWIVLALFWRMHAVPVPLDWATSLFPSSLLNYSYRYITAGVGSLFFVYVAMRYLDAQSKIVNLLSYFGKVSLGIYVLHLFIGSYVEPLYVGLFSSNTTFFYVVTDFFVKLLLSVGLIEVVNKIPLLDYLFLGGKKKNRVICSFEQIE